MEFVTLSLVNVVFFSEVMQLFKIIIFAIPI